MAKTYGSRWELIEPIAAGGQGEVFRVRDKAGEHSEPLALKRVLNPHRHARFRAEVHAIGTLDHPNVIKLIDHSAHADEDAEIEKQFLVMPLAREDLTRRVALYKGNVDSVIQVAQQLASALQTAHHAKIIHRDVKPNNILFPGAGHDAWLSDFGICLIRTQERVTGEAEIVGPVQFMAPELEQGGKLDVAETADVYSLGKVLYYMISGGIILPRERLNEHAFVKVFDQSSARQRLLQLLIGRMLSPLGSRISSMSDVLSELTRIAKWESGRLLPALPETLTRIEEFRRRALAAQQAQERQSAAIILRNEKVALVNRSVLDWAENKLGSYAELFGNGGGYSAGVRRRNVAVDVRVSDFRAGSGVELWIRSEQDRLGFEHVLCFCLCSSSKMTFINRDGKGAPSLENKTISEDSNLALLPLYTRVTRQHGALSWNFITTAGGVRLYVAPKMPTAGQHMAVRVATRFNPPERLTALMSVFSTADWPAITELFEKMAEQAIDTFTKVITPGA